MSTSSGNSTWTYNSKGQLTQFASPQGTISYAYDAAGRLTSYTDAAGTTSLTYDNASRVTSLVNPFSETTSWVYDAASRVTRQNFGNGAYETYSYDTRSRLTSVVLKNSGGATLSSHSYGYDAASQITSRTDDGVVTTFVYDAIGQLLSETKAGYAASYTYDANGNRLTKTLNGVPEYYTYDSADKLLSAGGKTYGYDAAGRVTSVTSSGQVTSLTYDYEDRVTSIAYPGGGANTFAYSGLGARVSKTDSTGSYTYRRNGSSVTSPVLSDGSAVYTPGISERRSGVSKFYHSDLKNGVQQTDSSQTFAAVRAYDAFGMPVSSSGAWAGPFGYGGKFGYQSDPDSGLMLLGHRYYDPSTGLPRCKIGVRSRTGGTGMCTAGTTQSRSRIRMETYLCFSHWSASSHLRRWGPILPTLLRPTPPANRCGNMSVRHANGQARPSSAFSPWRFRSRAWYFGPSGRCQRWCGRGPSPRRSRQPRGSQQMQHEVGRRSRLSPESLKSRGYDSFVNLMCEHPWEDGGLISVSSTTSAR
ncbi:MAG: hypothetical protein AKCLJLPJ_00018 [Fimbriimonadales bacterium]|nr:hypothetical protein [Fimbriimonadales bacterium]